MCGMSKVAVVIPARGGSKGIPDKNLRLVGGRSLIRRAVEAALASRYSPRVYVSTDSRRIAHEASLAGASVIDRPAELADDRASSESALLHALEMIPQPDILVLLQCTSPFVSAADLDLTVAPVSAGEADSTFTAIRSHGFLWRRDSDGSAIGVNHDHLHRLRRQDRPYEVLETGAVYAMNVAGFLKHEHRFFGRSVAVEVDSARSMEIDELEDLEVARSLALLVDGRPTEPSLPLPRLLALDFDGVFTDNRVHVNQEGQECVTSHRGDGMGIEMLKRHIPIAVFSTEKNPVVSARCAKLGVPVVQGLGNGKEEALRVYCRDRDIALSDVMFVGNDLNDLECLRAVGFGVAVADAVEEVKRAAHLVLTRSGGDGAIREICDALIRSIEREQGSLK